MNREESQAVELEEGEVYSTGQAEPKGTLVPNRNDMRRAKYCSRKGTMPRTTPNRTGSPAWFRQMKAKFEADQILRKAKTSILWMEFGDVVYRIAERFPNLLSLSKASKKEVLKVPGVGPATLKKMREYFSERSVKVNW